MVALRHGLRRRRPRASPCAMCTGPAAPPRFWPMSRGALFIAHCVPGGTSKWNGRSQPPHSLDRPHPIAPHLTPHAAPPPTRRLPAPCAAPDRTPAPRVPASPWLFAAAAGRRGAGAPVVLTSLSGAAHIVRADAPHRRSQWRESTPTARGRLTCWPAAPSVSLPHRRPTSQFQWGARGAGRGAPCPPCWRAGAAAFDECARPAAVLTRQR